MSRTHKTRRFTIESLEDRRLMAANTLAGAGGIYGPLPAEMPGGGGFLPDYALTAKVEASPYEPGKNQIVIDGSDYDDHVKILEYHPGSPNDLVKLQLSRWNGSTLISTQTINLPATNLGSAYPVVVNGKSGNDEITNFTYLPMQANGGVGSDTIQAGPGGGAIYGGSGRNYLFGGIGGDYINGGDDRDIIVGGEGSDTIYGNGGPDDIWGDYSINDSRYAFKDYIHGGAGDDVLWGGAGDDEIWGDAGRDTVFAGYGNDKVWGGNGDDTLYGEKGNDTLFGEADTDKVYGGDDDDKVDGGFGTSTNSNVVTADTVVGGQGRDKFVRHSSVFSFNEGDDFVDFNAGLGDTEETFYHW